MARLLVLKNSGSQVFMLFPVRATSTLTKSKGKQYRECSNIKEHLSVQGQAQHNAKWPSAAEKFSTLLELNS